MANKFARSKAFAELSERQIGNIARLRRSNTTLIHEMLQQAVVSQELRKRAAQTYSAAMSTASRTPVAGTGHPSVSAPSAALPTLACSVAQPPNALPGGVPAPGASAPVPSASVHTIDTRGGNVVPTSHTQLAADSTDKSPILRSRSGRPIRKKLFNFEDQGDGEHMEKDDGIGIFVCFFLVAIFSSAL